LSFSPRPFSSASLVETPGGIVFVKRHSRRIRDRAGLEEEHRFLAYLAAHCDLVQPALADRDGQTAIEMAYLTEDGLGEWTYEVHPPARGEDLYGQALSWTPFRSSSHAFAAGQALARLHLAAAGYDASARKPQPLVTSFTIFSSADPVSAMGQYLATRPRLREYAEHRDWRESFDALLLPLHRKLAPRLGALSPLWTHNDLHASNLIWADAGSSSEVTGIIDFGLADRTNAVHDLATAIERNIVEWLRMDDELAGMVHLDHLEALLKGYEQIRPLSSEEAQALPAILPLVHCEFALSETDYFLSVLNSEEKAYFAYEGYFLRHAAWFGTAQGVALLAYLDRWAEAYSSRTGGRS
jgi:Ser/Thr protein kinase RdoA (MazF antagonist)